MDVENLLSLLDDPAVQEKIKSLCLDTCPLEGKEEESNKRIDELTRTNQNLTKENVEMAGLIENLRELICSKEKNISEGTSKIQELTLQVNKSNELLATKKSEIDRISKANKDLKERLETSNEQVNWYHQNFSDDIKVQDIYSHLSEETRGSLGGIFKNTTLTGLIACGIQEKNIGNLWDYAKNEVVNGTNPDVEHIIQLFNILFSRFTLAFPMYESQPVTVGDDFDTQIHIKHSSSRNVSGAITTVLLPGYVSTKTGKVIKQSIVKI